MKKLMMILLSLTLMASVALGVACVTDTSSDGESGSGQQPPVTEYSTPVITVTPDVVEIYQGGEIDLTFGVTVTDEYDENLTAVIDTDDGFDNEVVGEYTIVYVATNSKGKTGTASRVVKVLPPKPDYKLEAQKNTLGDQKWPAGVYLNFADGDYYELTESTEYTTPTSGIFHNDTQAEITLTIAGGGGIAAILNANGIVIEGRDGANGKIVNAQNPVRATAPGGAKITVDEVEYPVTSNTYKAMVIPADGYAVVVHQGYAGEGGADADGRNFMNYNVIHQYGAAVRINNDGDFLFEYKDQAPSVSGNTAAEIAATEYNKDNVSEVVLKGLTVVDDNGTFELADDVKDLVPVIVAGIDQFNGDVAGTYEFSLEVEDANGNKASFKRSVTVMDASFTKVKIGNDERSYLAKNVAIDVDVTSVGAYAYIIYTPAYEGTVNFANAYGEAIITDAYGKVIYVFDGANAKFYDESNTAGVQNAGCTAQGYVQEAYEKWLTVEGAYLIYAPNSNSNNTNGVGSRDQILDNRSIGALVTVTGIEFKKDEVTFAIGENSVTVPLAGVLVNPTQSFTAANFDVLVYTSAKISESFVPTNSGWGFAVIVNKYGEIVHIFDGCSGKYYGDGEFTCTTSGYMTEAKNALGEEQMLVIGVNRGSADLSPAREFFRKSYVVLGAVLSIDGLGVKYEVKNVKDVIVIDGVTTQFDAGTVLVNPASVTVNATNLVAYTKDFTGTLVNNGYCCVVVIDINTFKILRVYDAANSGYYDVECAEGQTVADIKKPMEGWTNSNVVAYAFENLQPTEMMVIGLNGGPNGNAGRALMLGCRTKVGKTCAAYLEMDMSKDYIVIDGVTTEFDAGTVIADPASVTVNATNLVAYTKGFTGTLVNNGYCCVVVINAEGKIVRVYDAANSGYYDVECAAGQTVADIKKPMEGWTNSNVVAYAFENLQEGETMIVGLNGGPNGNAGRALMLGCRTKVGKAVSISALKPEFNFGL